MKPTKGNIKEIYNGLFPVDGSMAEVAVARLNRAACDRFLEQLEYFFTSKEDQETIERLTQEVKDLREEKGKVEYELNDAMERIEKLRNEVAEGREEAEKAKRTLENRTKYVEAKANEWCAKHGLTDEERAELKEWRQLKEDYDKLRGDYKILLKSIRQSENADSREYISRWRVLTKDVVRYHVDTKDLVLLSKADGKCILASWKSAIMLMGDPGDEDFSMEPFTHYMPIRRTRFGRLLNAEDPEFDETKCEGCVHHNVSDDNPNKCQLPACIKEVQNPGGKSINTNID